MSKRQPGQSGDSSSRPRVIREIRELVREHTDRAIAVLVEIMSSRKMPPACRISAAAHLLDRAYGRPPQEQHLVMQHADPFDDVMAMLAELRRLQEESESQSRLPRRDENRPVPDGAEDEVDLEGFRRSVV